jgi:hypothetical protein
MDKWKAQVKISTGTRNGSVNLQWVHQDARNSYEARLAIESKYGKLVQGPIKITGSSSTGRFADNW